MNLFKMSFNSIRYNSYHVIDHNQDEIWKNWTQEFGLPYFPVATEFEDWFFSKNSFTHLQEQMLNKWHYSVYFSIVYVILIPALKYWIWIRGQPYNLRTFLVIWNSILAVFSIFGVFRCLPEFYQILSSKGFTASFCESDYYRDYRLNMWYYLFTCSKVLELIDTLFIILRGGKLITLHWVHHVLTLTYSWYGFGDVPATARWMINMNFIAHSFMYTYYALRALRMHVPRVISISITTIQILQMVFGVHINYVVISRVTSGKPCDVSLSVGIVGLLLYILFLILFMKFFVDSYLGNPKNRRVNNDQVKNFIYDINLCKDKIKNHWILIIIYQFVFYDLGHKKCLKVNYFSVYKIMKYLNIIKVKFNFFSSFSYEAIFGTGNWSREVH